MASAGCGDVDDGEVGGDRGDYEGGDTTNDYGDYDGGGSRGGDGAQEQHLKMKAESAIERINK